jgi:hypothetical protein
MNKLMLILLLGSLVFSGCQAAPQSIPAPTNIVPLNTLQPLPTAAAASDKTPTPRSPSPVAPAVTAPPDEAITAAQAYVTDILAGNATGAAGRLSSYSLMVEEITHTEAAQKLQAQFVAEKWSNVQVLSAAPFNQKTSLVHVTYQVERKVAKTGESSQTQVDELWPLRLENGEWKINAEKLIDYHTLEVPEQTQNGLTIKPRRIALYTDAVRLTLLVQNRSNEPIVLGQPNEILAAFVFGDQHVEADKTRFIFDRLRSYPDVTITLKAALSSYPDGIIIRQWKNVKTAPWFTFAFNQ